MAFPEVDPVTNSTQMALVNIAKPEKKTGAPTQRRQMCKADREEAGHLE